MLLQRRPLMSLELKPVKFFIPNSNGSNAQTESVTFPRKVVTADCALREFKFEYVGAAAPSDIVQMGAVVVDDPAGTDTVTIKLSYNYSGAEYRGHAIVLVIAELEGDRYPR
jgi:hypothetical protein